ncbi:MAG: hypothetical protein CSA62_03005 [Planctomycetota bacterium]|nr:MAG: hypothetical protein CSA62_03005 [Planctomycetota bacterium]
MWKPCQFPGRSRAETILAGLLPLLLSACGHEPEKPLPAAPPGPKEVVLRIGDQEITQEQLNRHLPFLRKLDSQAAPAFLRRILLKDHILSKRVALLLAEPAQVADARRRGAALAKAVAEQGGDLQALMRLGKTFDGHESKDFITPRPTLPIDMAEAAWDCPVGRSTKAIETTYGVALIGVIEERERPAPLTGTERRLYTVFFPWSQDATFRLKVLRRCDRLLGEFRYVHPAYRDEFATFLPVSR